MLTVLTNNYEDTMKTTKKKIETLFGLAKERGWSPMWTHYYRRDKMDNKILAATSCILMNANFEPVSRGFCAVYFKANGDKAYGRMESLSRAFKAVVDGKYKTPVEWLNTRRIEGIGADMSPTKSVFPAAGFEWTLCDTHLTGVESDRIQARVGRKSKKSLDEYREEKALVA
jgi:hypothetical protein